MDFQSICNIIILIASVIGAIGIIYNTIKKPAVSMKKKQREEMIKLIKEVLSDTLPEELKQHDLEVRDRYKKDRETYLKDIMSEVLAQTKQELDQIS